MGNYSGMSYEQLVAYIMSGDPAALSQAARDWKQATRSADEVHGILRPKAQVVKPSYRGADGSAYGERLDTLGGFAKQLNVDAQDAYEGMLNVATALQQAQRQAEPIIAMVEAATGKEKEKLKKLAAKQLAAIMEQLAAAYQDTVDKKWHDPAPGPEGTGDQAEDRSRLGWDPAPVGQDPTGVQPLPYSTDPGHGGGVYQPYDPEDGLHGGGGLAGGAASAPTLPTGPAAGAPVAAATTAGAIGATPSVPPVMGGLAAAGGGAAAPSPAPRAAGRTPGATAGKSGPIGAGLMPPYGPHGEDEDERGEHTWLTEDEIPWTRDNSAPVVIGKQEYR